MMLSKGKALVQGRKLSASDTQTFRTVTLMWAPSFKSLRRIVAHWA